MKKKIINIMLSILLILNTSLFIISFSFAFTILFRPFYYCQITKLHIEEKTGYTYQEIKNAYDDVLDFSLFNKPFKTGVLKYSNEGKQHFKDCKRLFIIDFIILGLTTLILIIQKIFFSKQKLFNFSLSFWSSCLILIVLSIILLITLFLGFDQAFITFHHLLFPGKTNWIFNPQKDEIIKILPKEYFMNCAILIVSIITTISIVLILKEIYQKIKS